MMFNDKRLIVLLSMILGSRVNIEMIHVKMIVLMIIVVIVCLCILSVCIRIYVVIKQANQINHML